MCTRIKIAKEIVGQYHSRDCATINPAEVSYIEVDGNVLKDETQDKVKYETIYANSGGAFLPEWKHSDIKLLFILRESYILEDSFYNCKEPDRGGHKMNELYIEGRDWVWNFWENATYRNMVKITYLLYLEKYKIVDDRLNNGWGDVKVDACKVFREHAAVISANPFPGLAFNSTKTNQPLLKEWLSFPEIRSKLQSEVNALSPKCIYGAFDLGCVSSYYHLFGWLKHRTLAELINDLKCEQMIWEYKILSAGKFGNRPYLIDEFNVCWIQGIHPSSQVFLGEMSQIAREISSVLYTSQKTC
ncbi:MAG: hypothetical protein UFP03_03985 [Paludibacteraceae bacterium]|nr:hypothetical protein [Paludibacteraceae bacterium]